MSESSQAVTYQMVTLTQALSDSILKDDSPQLLQDEIWQFLGIDLSTANLSEVDFLNILDMVDIAFSNLLIGMPEDQWDQFRIVETVWDQDPATGRMIPMAKKSYPLTELWDAVKTKVYIKGCKSRGGFIMNVLTEQRSRINQTYTEAGPPRIPGMEGTQMPQQGQGKKWGMI